MRQPPRVINGAPASEIGNCHTGPVEDEYRVSASATPLTQADIDQRRPDLAPADKMAYFEADANNPRVLQRTKVLFQRAHARGSSHAILRVRGETPENRKAVHLSESSPRQQLA